jgi:zinc D-Ala-D-Ala carboxypeptidase
MPNVSAHITYAEAIRSDIAKRYGINNYFTPAQLVNMKVLAEKVFEPLRKHFGVPIFISSFFRNVKLNELMGGVPDSQHLCNNGAAMDLDSDLYNTISNKQIFDYIKDHLDFDQLIAESFKKDGTMDWVHCSYVSKKANRHEVLKMKIINGKKVYENYE